MPPIKLKQILDEHHRHSSRVALKQNLGDGYLLRHNPIFKQIRQQALDAGYRFSANRFQDYDVLALTQLPQILKSKTIPFRDNVRPLRKIEDMAPKAFLFSQVPALTPNRLFHESAHAIAHSALAKRARRSEKEQILSILTEEAFANACESLANAYSVNPLHDEFLHQNSYIMEKPKTRESLRRALTAVGRTPTFAVLFFSFLHANFLRSRITSRDFNRVMDLLGLSTSLSAELRRPLRAVFRVGLDLDPEFTQFTNAFCLRLGGFKKPLHRLLEFDFISIIEKSPTFSAELDGLLQLFHHRTL